ncbi:hypothetical protein NPIL_442001, partial [Nephila pilipes]
DVVDIELKRWSWKIITVDLMLIWIPSPAENVGERKSIACCWFP